MNLNKIQKSLRDSLSKNNITTTIEDFKQFLYQNDFENDNINDALLVLSSRHTELHIDSVKNIVSYEQLQREKSRLVNDLNNLINDITLLKTTRKEEDSGLSVFSSQMQLVIREQDDKLSGAREELYAVNKIINLIVDEVKAKSQLLERSQKDKEWLLKDIERLNKNLEDEKIRYDALQKKYEALKLTSGELENVKRELEYLKRQVEEKSTHVKILADAFVTHKQIIENNEETIKALRKKLNE
jgi:chromosome segregation ATPase